MTHYKKKTGVINRLISCHLIPPGMLTHTWWGTTTLHQSNFIHNIHYIAKHQLPNRWDKLGSLFVRRAAFFSCLIISMLSLG